MMHIGLLGFGVVGGGVWALCAPRDDLNVKRVLLRSPKEGLPEEVVTFNADDILNDPEIDTVVEVMGGLHPAYEYVSAALARGKNVVTANKALIAAYYTELTALAREKGAALRCTAAVGGGIPWLTNLERVKRLDTVCAVGGIMNGTTNFIMDAMHKAPVDFPAILKEAQDLGYAEADPTADVAGIDAGRKTCILADLAFGRETPPEKVPMEGITALDLRDVAIARQAGFRVKLLGRTLRLPDGGYAAYVAPHLIPEGKPIAHVSGVFNAAVVRGSAVGETMFYGPGAGAYPTASACVADVMNVLAGPAPFRFRWEAPSGLRDANEVVSRWYLRTDADAQAVKAAFPQAETLTEGAFLTGPLTGFALEERAKSLPVLARYRVLD